jgi:hypothetical protein
MSYRVIRPLFALGFSVSLMVGSAHAQPPVVPAQTTVPAGPVVSGPQVGDKVPGPFQPLNVTGPNAGKHSCLYCKFGMHPVVMIFAREVTAPVLQLIKQVDAATAAHNDLGMGSCVIVCTDTDGVAPQLEALAKQQNLSHLVLATFHADGPKPYQIAPDAEVTVLLYTHGVVKANYAFRKGEMAAVGIQGVLTDLPKILKAE